MRVTRSNIVPCSSDDQETAGSLSNWAFQVLPCLKSGQEGALPQDEELLLTIEAKQLDAFGEAFFSF